MDDDKPDIFENGLNPLSQKTSMEDDRNFVEKLIDNLESKINGKEQDVEEKYEEKLGPLEGDVHLPFQQEVIDQAIKIMKNVRQEKKAEQLGVTDEEKIRRLKVEFDFSNPLNVLVKFGIAAEQIHDELLSEVEERNTDDGVTNPIISTKDPTMTRVIAKNIGPINSITIFYGSRNVIYNLTDELGYTDDELNLVRLCNQIAAHRNGLHRYTMVDDVLLIDRSLSKRVSVDEEENGSDTQKKQSGDEEESIDYSGDTGEELTEDVDESEMTSTVNDEDSPESNKSGSISEEDNNNEEDTED